VANKKKMNKLFPVNNYQKSGSKGPPPLSWEFRDEDLPGDRNVAGTGSGLRRFGTFGILAAGSLADGKARERKWNSDQAARMPPVPGFRWQDRYVALNYQQFCSLFDLDIQISGEFFQDSFQFQLHKLRIDGKRRKAAILNYHLTD